MESLKKYIDCKYWKRKKATYFAFYKSKLFIN